MIKIKDRADYIETLRRLENFCHQFRPNCYKCPLKVIIKSEYGTWECLIKRDFPYNDYSYINSLIYRWEKNRNDNGDN